jgi:hypothetical protein
VTWGGSPTFRPSGSRTGGEAQRWWAGWGRKSAVTTGGPMSARRDHKRAASHLLDLQLERLTATCELVTGSSHLTPRPCPTESPAPASDLPQAEFGSPTTHALSLQRRIRPLAIFSVSFPSLLFTSIIMEGHGELCQRTLAVLPDFCPHF